MVDINSVIYYQYNCLVALLAFSGILCIMSLRVNDSGCLPLRVLSNGTVEGYKWMVTSTGIIVAVSVVVCLVAMVLILAMRLHTKLVYRLTLYQIITILLVMVIWVVYLALLFATPRVVKYAVEVVLKFFAYTYQLLSTWIVVHLFALTVWHKSLDRLEPLYLASSFLTSLVISVISLALVFVGSSETNSPHCVVYHMLMVINEIGFALITLLVVVNFSSVIIIGLVLCNRAYHKRNGDASLYDKQHKKVLYEMLPLMISSFCSIVIPGLCLMLIHSQHVMDYSSHFIMPFFTLAACVAIQIPVIIHLTIVIYIRKRNILRHTTLSTIDGTEGSATVQEESSRIFVRSSTYCSMPIDA